MCRMSVLKIKKNGNWEEVIGGMYATSTSSDADTVDGKHASEFASASDVEILQQHVGDTSVSEQIGVAISSISYPVNSVNGKTGSVQLTATDVGALSSDTEIPSIDGLATEEYVNNAVINKVDKIDGKSLSTNDYTTEEKEKLATIQEGATNTVVDTELSATSVNPVQNKIVNEAISSLNTLVGDTSVSTQISTAINDHTHNYAGADEAGGSAINAKKVEHGLTINQTTSDGVTNTFTYDGSSAQELSIDLSSGSVGKSLEGQIVCPTSGASVTAGVGAEIFNDYNERTFDESDNTVVGGNVATGDYSHAEGWGTTASNVAAHVEGKYNTASGYSSHVEGAANVAEGQAAHAEGCGTSALGDYSHTEGNGTTSIGMCGHAEGAGTTALEMQHVQGRSNDTSTATAGAINVVNQGTAFVIGNGTSSAPSNAFRVTYAGAPYAKSSLNTTGADYAEFFEWQDGNTYSEDRRGYFVTLDGDKIKIAETNDYILGIVSGQPAVIGNADEAWMGRYVFDEFGAFVYEEFEYEEVVGHAEKVDEETGKITLVEIKETRIGTKYKENPDYDPSIAYIQREDRPEWDAVGMVGVLSVRDDGTCQVNGYCKVSSGGIATTSDSGYRVIKRITDNIVKVVFR